MANVLSKLRSQDINITMRGKMQPEVPTDYCECDHLLEDHEPSCIVIEDGKQCLCRVFVPAEEDGYFFTDDEGNPL